MTIWLGRDILSSRGTLALETKIGDYTDANGVVVTYGSWTATGANSSGVAKDNVCSVDEDGLVTAGSAAAHDDTCTIRATAQAEGYLDHTEIIATLTVENVQDPPDQNVDSRGVAYGTPGNPTVGSSYPIVNAPSGGGFGGSQYGGLKYYAFASIGSVCNVDRNTGEVEVRGTGACTVYVEWGGQGDYTRSDWVVIWRFTVAEQDGGITE